MARLIDKGVDSPRLVMLARWLAVRAGQRRPLAQAMAIRDWLARVWRFVDDPAGRELLRDVDHMLNEYECTGAIAGDCDEAATLGAALGAAVGLTPELVVLAWSDDDGGNGGTFSHVYARLLTPDSGRVSLDVTRPREPIPPPTRQQVFAVVNGTLAQPEPGAVMYEEYEDNCRSFVGLGASADTVNTYVSGGRVVASQGADIQADYDLARRLYAAWFGGAARDAARDDRAAWLMTLAQHGNVRAGQAILGGQGEMSGGEHDRYVRAESYVRTNGVPGVMDDAAREGAYWSYEDASNYPKLRAFVQGWVGTLAGAEDAVRQVVTAGGGLPVAALVGVGVIAYLAMRKR
jgi:hypothetical protein